MNDNFQIYVVLKFSESYRTGDIVNEVNKRGSPLTREELMDFYEEDVKERLLRRHLATLGIKIT